MPTSALLPAGRLSRERCVRCGAPAANGTTTLRPGRARRIPRLTGQARGPNIAAMVGTFPQPWFTLDVVLTFDFPHA